MADRLKALAALGALSEDAERRGDDRAIDRLNVVLAAFTDALALASITEQKRAADRKRKRNSAESVESVEPKPSVEFRGKRRNSADSTEPVQEGPSSLKADNTSAHEAIAAVGDAQLDRTLIAARLAYGPDWHDIEAFLLRRPYVKWQHWLDEMARAVGISSQFTVADLARVCRDDALLKDPLGSGYALRKFLTNARIERMNAGADRPPPKAGAGLGTGTGARAFATTMAAIEDL